jgi:hypothetical protein
VLECRCCGRKWSNTADDDGELPSDFWVCLLRCNWWWPRFSLTAITGQGDSAMVGIRLGSQTAEWLLHSPACDHNRCCLLSLRAPASALEGVLVHIMSVVGQAIAT